MPAVTAGPPPATVEAAVRGDLVWAKIYGFPWWPSVVRDASAVGDAERPRLRVVFLRTYDDCELPLGSIAAWESMPDMIAGKLAKIKSKAVTKQWHEAVAEALARRDAAPPTQEVATAEVPAEEAPVEARRGGGGGGGGHRDARR